MKTLEVIGSNRTCDECLGDHILSKINLIQDVNSEEVVFRMGSKLS